MGFLILSVNLNAQSITLVSSMIFPVQTWGVGITVTLAANDAGAAVFNATGMIPGRTVTCSISSSSVNITTTGGTGANYRIPISNYTISGCTAVVPATGVINNIRVGARATITASKAEGVYSGTNTFRLVTN